MKYCILEMFPFSYLFAWLFALSPVLFLLLVSSCIRNLLCLPTTVPSNHCHKGTFRKSWTFVAWKCVLKTNSLTIWCQWKQSNGNLHPALHTWCGNARRANCTCVQVIHWCESALSGNQCVINLMSTSLISWPSNGSLLRNVAIGVVTMFLSGPNLFTGIMLLLTHLDPNEKKVHNVTCLSSRNSLGWFQQQGDRLGRS